MKILIDREIANLQEISKIGNENLLKLYEVIET